MDNGYMKVNKPKSIGRGATRAICMLSVCRLSAVWSDWTKIIDNYFIVTVCMDLETTL